MHMRHTFEYLSSPHSNASRTSSRDRIRPPPPVLSSCDMQQSLKYVDERCFDWKSKVPVSASCNFAMCSKKRSLILKPHPKPHKLRASCPGSNYFYDMQQKGYVNWLWPKYNIQRSLLWSWSKLEGWQIQLGWDGESRAHRGVSEEGSKDTGNQVRTTNTQKDIHVMPR
jgi:hypothetical protein